LEALEKSLLRGVGDPSQIDQEIKDAMGIVSVEHLFKGIPAEGRLLCY
jgi:hypothetical protein